MNGGVIFRFPLKRKQILIHPNIEGLPCIILKINSSLYPFYHCVNLRPIRNVAKK